MRQRRRTKKSERERESENENENENESVMCDAMCEGVLSTLRGRTLFELRTRYVVSCERQQNGGKKRETARTFDIP